MNTTIVILIILVIVILLVFFLNTPTCKNMVSGAKRNKVQSGNLKPSIPFEHFKAKYANSKNKIHGGNPQPRPIQVDPKKKHKKSQGGNPQPKPVQDDRVKELKDIKFDKNPIKVLSGGVEDMFTPKVDLVNEFGITNAELDRMARDYSRKHLEASAPSVPRHRSIRRRNVDYAEKALRESFMRMASKNEKIDADEFTAEAYRKNIMKAESRKKQPKRSKRIKSFAPRNNK